MTERNIVKHWCPDSFTSCLLEFMPEGITTSLWNWHWICLSCTSLEEVEEIERISPAGLQYICASVSTEILGKMHGTIRNIILLDIFLVFFKGTVPFGYFLPKRRICLSKSFS